MQETQCEAVVSTIGIEQFSSTEELELLPAEGGWSPAAIAPILKLGAGRAAEAWLVRAVDAQGTEQLCVEKIFRPGWLTRAIYRCAFQAPFAYQASQDAVLACFYRRRVAARLVKVLLPETAVSEPLYVRWDKQRRAYVLGCQLIQGRGIRPASVDTGMLQRVVRHLFGLRLPETDRTPAEIEQLLILMEKLEALFRECGLIGSGWQVSISAMVSTANLLKTPSGYVLVDLESGIPAILVPAYLAAGRQLQSLPLFDDIEPRTLRGFLENHWLVLGEKLGRGGFQQLSDDVELLIQHNRQWKQAEIALGRRGTSVFSRTFQNAYRERCISIWQRRELVDAQTAAQLRSENRLWSRPLYWLGLIPGAPGRFLQRLCGNRHFRAEVRRAVLHRSVRSELVSKYCAHARRLSGATRGEFPPTCSFNSITIRFVVNFLLSRLTPVSLQRWCVDGEQRRTFFERILLLSVSGRFQRAYGRHAIRSAIADWAAAGRLHAGEYEPLQRESASNELDEYARCFGMHLSLKLITPILLPLKIGGVAVFAATGEAIYLMPMLISPILRTAITLWRMFRNGRRGLQYGEALLIGMLPVLGNLAYPVQMYASHRRLSTFLIRDSAARLARWLPIYGGQNSRLEIAAVKAANFPLGLLDAGLALAAKIRSVFPKRTVTRKIQEPVENAPVTDWDQLVQRHIQLLNEAEIARRPIPEQIEQLLQQQKRFKPAA